MKTLNSKECKVVALWEMPLPSEMLQCETPDQVVGYWNKVISVMLVWVALF
jgi:hypothetical protein